jgi:hypothetical protein
MKKETLDKICEYCVTNATVKVKHMFTEEDFYERLDLHQEGRKRVEALWQGEVDNGDFPPKPLTLLGYYFHLLSCGILTEHQYDQLQSEL